MCGAVGGDEILPVVKGRVVDDGGLRSLKGIEVRTLEELVLVRLEDIQMEAQCKK